MVMASINVSEDDFQAVAIAAMTAKDEGDMEQAVKLDKIARKINAALTGALSRPYAWIAGERHKPVRWEDMPSTLKDPT
jgi:hypothetical protein